MINLRDFSPICSILGRSIRRGIGSNHQIALTFDDGPHPYFTPKILDVLDKHDVTASFFVVGNRLEKFPDITWQTCQLGHTIGNHTYSHPSLLFSGRKTVLAEMSHCDRLITQIIGKKAALFRPPFGRCNFAAYSVAQMLGYEIVFWSLDPRDWERKRPATIINQVVNQIHPGAIVLLHDGQGDVISKDRSASVEVLEKIIPIIKRSGYDLVNLDTLLQN